MVGDISIAISESMISMELDKEWLSYADQVRLLQEHGLIVDDPIHCETVLSQVNLYRFFGYFRYWQGDPSSGENQFIPGASFERIWDLYRAEEDLKAACMPLLSSLEVMTRTRFAHHYANLVGSTRSLAEGEGLTPSPTRPDGSQPEGVQERALRNLDHCKEPFISRYLDTHSRELPYPSAAYERMPIWVAVEAFTFGALSKLIEASKDSGVLDAIADSMKVSRRDLPSQIRSFVYLRNRIAHCSKLWNHAVLDRPALQQAQARRAREVRDFDDMSVYRIFVAMDAMAKKTGLRDNWLEEDINPILVRSPLLASGIATPKKYGQMPLDLLMP